MRLILRILKKCCGIWNQIHSKNSKEMLGYMNQTHSTLWTIVPHFWIKHYFKQKDKQWFTKHFIENIFYIDRASWIPGGELWCSGTVNSSCSTSGSSLPFMFVFSLMHEYSALLLSKWSSQCKMQEIVYMAWSQTRTFF